jgi:predicted nucleic acid-binding protein
VSAALAHFRARPSLGFSDGLVPEIARRNGHQPLVTFDKALGRLDGARRL